MDSASIPEKQPTESTEPAARGRRPEFTDDPMVDRLYSLSLALVAELAVTRARLDTLERVLTRRELVAADDMDTYETTPEEQEARAQMHQEYLARVFHQAKAG